MRSKWMFIILFLICGLSFKGVFAISEGYFWHLTDIHWDPTYSTEELTCHKKGQTKGVFGDMWCGAPLRLVNATIKQMTDVKQDVDFIIWTGDTIGHFKNKTLRTLKNNLDDIQKVTDMLTDAFPNTTVLPSIGNHDFFPDNKAQNNGEFNARVADIWAHWLGKNSQEYRDFKKGGYFAVDVSAAIKMIVLNTNLYFKAKYQTEDDEDPFGQLAWFRQQADHARNTSRKIMVSGHVAVGVMPPTTYDSFKGKFTERFLKTILEYSDVITVMHFAHAHDDAFLLANMKGKGPIPEFVAPSMTPWRYVIPNFRTGPEHNPAVRLVKYDRETGRQLDYDQYFMDLAKSNSKGIAIWTKLYTFTESYGVEDMSVESLRVIFRRMEDPESKEGRTYCNWLNVQPTPQRCTLAQRAEIYCAGVHTLLPEVQKCSLTYINEANRPVQNSQISNHTRLGFGNFFICFMTLVINLLIH